MKSARLLLLILCCITIGCAQVPKESVKLSATVGRDLVEMKKSHIALLDIYYESLVGTNNGFIDHVYLPYQIQESFADDELGREILLTTAKSEFFREAINEDIEAYRTLRLEPVQAQYEEIFNMIDAAYKKTHDVNFGVTKYLASVAKSQDIPKKVLKKLAVKGLKRVFGNFTTPSISGIIAKVIKKIFIPENDKWSFAAGEIRAKQLGNQTSEALQEELMTLEQFEQRLGAKIAENREAFETEYKKELNALVGLSEEEIATITPVTTDIETVTTDDDIETVTTTTDDDIETVTTDIETVQ